MIKKLLVILFLTFFGGVSFADTTVTGSLSNYTYKLNFTAWGDSLTLGNQDGLGDTYPSYLHNIEYGRTIFNYGYGGYTSSQILTVFQANPSLYLNTFNVIWSGRNDAPGGFVGTLTNIETMTGAIPSRYGFLVLSVLNANVPTEISGQTTYNNIINFNASLASQYPNNYLDIRSYLISLYNSGLPEDVIDHGNDVVPTSLRCIDFSGTITQNIGTSDTSFTISGSPTIGSTMYIGTEKIYIIGLSGGTVTNCTRGYAGSTAQSFSSGQAWTARDNLHLNGAGYSAVASYVSQWIHSHTSL